MINWVLKQFHELDAYELYAILRLRSEVFVVEQHCAFLDMDGKDQPSAHLMGWQGNDLVAYTRLVPPGIAFAEPSIGRVVTSSLVRGTGAGRQLMIKSIETAKQLYGKSPIHIGAQLYLEKFYRSLGFEVCSPVYDEDGIDHIEMLRPVS